MCTELRNFYIGNQDIQKEFEKFKVKKTNQRVPKVTVAINPDKVLLGDTELNNLGPPKIFPKIYFL